MRRPSHGPFAQGIQNSRLQEVLLLVLALMGDTSYNPVNIVGIGDIGSP